MPKSMRVVGVLLMMLAAVSSAEAQSPASVQAPVSSAQAPASSTAAPVGQVVADPSMNDYKLGVADHVRMTVYNEPDLSGEFSVSSNGVLSLPLIGDVQVLGMTSSQVVDIVQKKLGQGYLRDPRVSLEVLSYRPFYILGEVTKPGEYPYSNGLTVLNAVATAQGYTYRANKKRVFIKHAGNADEEELKVTPGLMVQPGDTVRIGERYF